MNIRSRTIREVVKGLDEQSSLPEIILSSSASKAESNRILAEIINQRHQLHFTRVASDFMSIVKAKVA
jgi:Ran GTPase-activating protein (RanGAP) involved in mRNA processing and transport